MRLLNTCNYHTRYIATGYAVNRRKAPARRVSSIRKNVLEEYLYTRSRQPLNDSPKTGLLLDFLLSHASVGRLVPFFRLHDSNRPSWTFIPVCTFSTSSRLKILLSNCLRVVHRTVPLQLDDTRPFVSLFYWRFNFFLLWKATIPRFEKKKKE